MIEAYSDNRLLLFLRRNLVELLTLAYLFTLVYVSILPLDFAASAAPAGIGRHFLGLPLSAPNLPDVASNVGLYVPFGMLLCAVFVKRGAGPLMAAMISTLFLAGLSLALEWSQQYSPSRISCATDFIANAIGAMVGSLLAPSLFWLARRAIRMNRKDVRKRSSAVLARLLALSLVGIAWIPFDLTFSADRVADSLHRSSLVPFARIHALQQAADHSSAAGDSGAVYRFARDAWLLRLDALGDAAGYALLAILTAWYLRRHCRTAGIRTAQWTLVACLWLAVFAAAGQVFVSSRGFDSTYLVAALVGTVLGVLAFAPVVQAWGHAQEVPRSRKTLLGCAIAGIAAFILLRQTAPFMPSLSPESVCAQASAAEWVPMTIYFQARLPAVMADLLGKLIRFGVLGIAITLYRATSANPRATRPLVCGLLVAFAMAVTECVQLLLPSRVPSITDVLLAGAGAAAGVQACRLALAVREEIVARHGIPAEPVAILYNVELGVPEEGPPEPSPAPRRRRRTRRKLR